MALCRLFGQQCRVGGIRNELNAVLAVRGQNSRREKVSDNRLQVVANFAISHNRSFFEFSFISSCNQVLCSLSSPSPVHISQISLVATANTVCGPHSEVIFLMKRKESVKASPVLATTDGGFRTTLLSIGLAAI